MYKLLYRPGQSKPIPNFTDYSLTREGRVWSSKSQRWLKTHVHASGYELVALRHPVLGTQSKTVHRLVLETFVGPCPPGMEGRHLDGNKQNNGLENLRWGTHYENVLDSIVHGTFVKPLCGEKNGQSKLSNAQAEEIRQLLTSGVAQKELAEQFGISQVTVSNIKLQKTYKCIG